MVVTDESLARSAGRELTERSEGSGHPVLDDAAAFSSVVGRADPTPRPAVRLRRQRLAPTGAGRGGTAPTAAWRTWAYGTICAATLHKARGARELWPGSNARATNGKRCLEQGGFAVQDHRRVVERELIPVFHVHWWLVLEDHRSFASLALSHPSFCAREVELSSRAQVALPLRALLVTCDPVPYIGAFPDINQLPEPHLTSRLQLAVIDAVDPRRGRQAAGILRWTQLFGPFSASAKRDLLGSGSS